MALLLKTEAWLGFGFLFIGLCLGGVVPFEGREEEGAECWEGKDPLKGEESMVLSVVVDMASN